MHVYHTTSGASLQVVMAHGRILMANVEDVMEELRKRGTPLDGRAPAPPYPYSRAWVLLRPPAQCATMRPPARAPGQGPCPATCRPGTAGNAAPRHPSKARAIRPARTRASTRPGARSPSGRGAPRGRGRTPGPIRHGHCSWSGVGRHPADPDHRRAGP